jgi:hypothetical protein
MDYTNYNIFNPKDKLSERKEEKTKPDEEIEKTLLDQGIEEIKKQILFNADDDIPSEKAGFKEFYRWKEKQTNRT